MTNNPRKLRPSWEFSDQLIQNLARQLGNEEFLAFNNEELIRAGKEVQSETKARIKKMIFDALSIVADGVEAPIPSNAIVLDTENKLEFWTDLSRRRTVGDNEVRPPAEVLSERFRTKVGESIWLTESEIAEEALRVYHERGIKSKTLREVVTEAISARCQSVVSKHLQSQYGSPSSRKASDYSHFELALALLQKSLDNFENGDGLGCELTYVVDGFHTTYQVPAWKCDHEGFGYRNQYPAITRSYIVKACNQAPINKMVNLNKVNEWIKNNNIQGISENIKKRRGA